MSVGCLPARGTVIKIDRAGHGNRNCRGGADGDILERLLSLHREHAHLDKRYAALIQEFDAGFEYGRLKKWHTIVPYLPHPYC